MVQNIRTKGQTMICKTYT